MRKLLLLGFLISSFFITQAQSLTGVISDSDNRSISNAHITTNSGAHTYSTKDGKFVIEEVKIGDTLLITHISYMPQSVILTDLKSLTIILSESSFELTAVEVRHSVKAINSITEIDVAVAPVTTSQEVLRKVPGLVIGQHAGGGKAEQIFLRGFDIDHGTDVAISVDGMPVNMASHAHGQGYADLHFVIPETIEEIDFGKGPYYADKGNFNTAGYVAMKTKDKLDESLVSIEYGQFNTIRALGMFNLMKNKPNQDAYVAGEFQLTDGPFKSSQNFNRINLMAKYNTAIDKRQFLSVQASYFNSKWDASGQIPVRAVESGLIGRFGAIDDTEGGNTHRINAAMNHRAILGDHTTVTSNAFYSRYGFELYSNFTFFLDDSINGDQIKQFERRNLAGFESVVDHHFHLNKGTIGLKGGLGMRYDDVNDVELSHTANRDSLIEPFALGDIDESNIYTFVGADFEFGDFLINAAVRLDHFKFDYHNKLDSIYNSQSEQTIKPSPKFNVIYSPSNTWQLYLKTGMGFHSNDTRVVVAQNGLRTLPTAYGADLGVIIKPLDNLMINAGGWYLYLEQEFVYVGDAAIVEPSGRTQRLGADISVRYQPLKWLLIYADFNYAFARALNEPKDANYIPLSADLTSVGGITINHPIGIQAGINYRWIGDRPANEDYSLTAKGYFVADANLSYTWRKWTAGVVIQNLFNTEWNETQFATESRLLNETTSVEEIHFTPGTPFFIRGKVSVRF
ncbi:MAG TPA: TonB-dependent receptor [Flavobacteriales bacterium]|nr:TonB-dependent receptor [Flavobacteriales bacterium]